MLQCLQYLQFLQALQVPEELQVASSVQQRAAIFFWEGAVACTLLSGLQARVSGIIVRSTKWAIDLLSFIWGINI